MSEIIQCLPSVSTEQDYYPFGMLMPDRSFSAIDGYRFGFNGKLRDDDLKGDGNSYDFGARVYDSRLGRWMSGDPLERKYPMNSTYVFALNSPNYIIDPDGGDNIVYVVNLPNSKGELEISNEELTKQISDANSYASNNHLTVQYVLYDPQQNGGDIDADNLDNTDAIILVGNPEEVKAYDRKNSLTSPGNSASGENNMGWTGGEDNPEETRPTDKVGYIDGRKSTRDFRAGGMIYIIFHSTGHIAGGDHFDTDGEGNFKPNTLNSGDIVNRVLAGMYKKGVDPSIKNWSSYMKQAMKSSSNTYMFNKINSFFSAPKTKDNYLINKFKNDFIDTMPSIIKPAAK